MKAYADDLERQLVKATGPRRTSSTSGGESFGGNYFGTGDSVLKQWWGAKDADQHRTAGPAESANPENADFSHAVPFEQGATRFSAGDKITITEIHGTAERFTPGNVYRIRGTYSLASHDSATLAAYTTAKYAKDGFSHSRKIQSTVVNRGDGTFTLYLPMTCEGWPHVSFYPAGGGDGFGGNYFGTGETVLKRWWGSKEAF
jgi:hypothetical protein